MDETVRPEDASDAEQAFLALASEVATMRVSVQELPKTLETLRSPDYGADLGKIAKQLTAIGEGLNVIRSYPYLNMTPQQHGEAIAQASAALIAKASEEFEKAANITHFEGNKLKSLLGHVRNIEQQRKWLIGTAAGGLAIGFILFPLLAAIGPFGLNERIAAGIVGKDRWGAGQTLMEAGNPQAFAGLVEGNRLITLNEEKIGECQEAARKANKEQVCPITVPTR